MKTLEQFKQIQAEGLEIFERKNKDYADSFREEGVLGVMIRMKDKLSRAINLARHEGEVALCKDEQVRDTLIDLHNYAALAVICHEAGDGWEQKPRYHRSQSIHLALTLKDEDLERLLKHDDGSTMLPLEARKKLMELRDRGFDLMPVGDCNNFDPKKGCMGHEE